MNSKLPNHCLDCWSHGLLGRQGELWELVEDLLKVVEQRESIWFLLDSLPGLSGFWSADRGRRAGWMAATKWFWSSPHNFLSTQKTDCILHGVSICELTEDWSLAHFVTFARSVMRMSWANQRQIVGGTGCLGTCLVMTKHQWFSRWSCSKKCWMNQVRSFKNGWDSSIRVKLWADEQSDRANSRWLIGAIEIAMWKARQTAEKCAVVGSDEDDIKWSQVENEVVYLLFLWRKFKAVFYKELWSVLTVERSKRSRGGCCAKTTEFDSSVNHLGVPEITSISREKSSQLSANNCGAPMNFSMLKRQLTCGIRISCFNFIIPCM